MSDEFFHKFGLAARFRESTKEVDGGNYIKHEDETEFSKATSNALKEARGGMMDEPCHPLHDIFEECLAQVTSGKGQERHGDGKDFNDQPWKHIADTHGVGFLTGQAEKKLREAQGFDDIDRWEREMFGVIVYAAMAILYRTDFEE